MEPRQHEYLIDVFADPDHVKEVVKGILHTIFFHRFFPCIKPRYHDVLEVTLPLVDDVELETLIARRATDLVHQLDTSDAGARNNGLRGQVLVQFFERKRKKTGWFLKGEEDVCWEQWTLQVTLASPRTEVERKKVRGAMEMTLSKTAMKIVMIACQEKDHIPAINQKTESNPFPFLITINPKSSWGTGMGFQ